MSESGVTKSKNIVHLAMRRPISVLVVVFAVALAAILSLIQMPRDILPNSGVPVIYVAQPYGGLSPAQVESYMTYYYEYHFLYLTGIEHVESKNIESTALIKLQFHPETDMAQAMAETVSYINRARAFMPTGVVPPFVIRFDTGSEPVGDLVFSSESKSLVELQNLALNNVRPLFATLQGVSAPPPFGASQRTLVVEVDPTRLKKYNLSPSDVATAISKANTIIPYGNIQTGDQYPIVPVNSVVKEVADLDDVPIRLGTYPTVFLKDIGRAVDGSDLPTCYALVNGRRTVYIPVTKRANASTLSVVDLVQSNLKKFQTALPQDVKVSYEFDQSGYVRRAIGSLAFEALLGAILTGLMVLLFLRDWRSSFIVVLNIPLALMGAVFALWVSKQTINIMTLGGLALAVGILVDETTVTIENIHSHLSRGKGLARAAVDGTNEILKPALLTMLCVLAVFIPSFFMTGIGRALFVPLTLAVGFSLIASFLLSRTLVPVLSTWILSHQENRKEESSRFDRFRDRYGSFLNRLLRYRKTVIAVYLGATIGIAGLLLSTVIGREIFPKVDLGLFQLRLRAPVGTWITKTEAITRRVLGLIQAEVGEKNLRSSLAFVGSHPSSYPINNVYLFTSGPQEAVLQVALNPDAKIPIEALEDRLRKAFAKELPEVEFSFEPSGIVDRVMAQGAPTPIEVAVSGRNLEVVRKLATKVREDLSQIRELRDLQFGQALDYPAVRVELDRRSLGLKGFTVEQVGQALIPATSSSRFVLPSFWSDPKNGITYQVQVEVPPGVIHSEEELKKVPISLNGGTFPLGELSNVRQSSELGEIDRYNMQRVISVTANFSGTDLGHVAGEVTRRVGELKKTLFASPEARGTDIAVRGEIKPMNEMFDGLLIGLLVAVVVVFLLLSANFESLWLALIVLSGVPAVLCGVTLVLAATRTTLNVESFMGTIMAIGVSVANAILLVTFSERSRVGSGDSLQSALEGAKSRIRPILMTSFAMTAGMIPMALGLSEGGQQAAPLGRAVVGGLSASTLATLFVLPLIFAAVQGTRSTRSPSLDPDDPGSPCFDREELA